MEVVIDLNCDNFIHAFRRFTSRRGFPQIMLSNNATTFVGASTYLESINSNPRVTTVFRKHHCEWRFVPAHAPWFGAVWERIIGIVTACLKKTLGKALVSREELITVVSEVEAIVNDRPLTYASGDLNDPEPLTPFLRQFPEEIINENEVRDPTYRSEQSMRMRLAYVNKLSENLWKRWSH